MKIVELRQISQGRYLIVFDDGTELKTPMPVVADLSLYTDKELSKQEFRALLNAQALAGTKSLALKIVNSKSISRNGLIRRLREKGESEENAEIAAQWLEELGYIDDEEFAANVVRYYSEKGYGRARIRNELYRRGVPRELWDDALAGQPDMDGVIDAILDSKLGGGIPSKAELRRVTDALFRRGYSWDDISSAILRYKERIVD